ncbi:MAG: SAM-dependent methyltransferase [Actinomycetota bacterium]
MELCLYDPEVGFFSTGGGAGRSDRDFVTSPEIGPLFGEVVARALDRWWDQLDRPEAFTVVDAGAGRGTLARAILAAEPACRTALELVLVERSAALRGEHPAGVTSVGDMPQRIDIGVVVANELLDNLAFRVIERTEAGWCDVVVDLDDDGLTERLGPPVGAAAGDGPIGARVPIQTAARAWVVSTIAAVGLGGLVAIDYTSTTAELARLGDAGWLRTYRGQQRGGSPLDRPGGQDLTADVCLDQLPEPDETIAQADFLGRHGIGELVEEGRRIWQERAHLGDLEAMRARSRVAEAEALTDRDGLGGFVLAVWNASGGRGPTITL